MRTVALPLLALLVAFAAGTWAVGWWAVPALALAHGLWRRGRAPGAVFVGLTAGLAWGLLLAAAAATGPVGALAARLATLMGLSAPALYAATIVCPALLAWSAAALGGAVTAPSRHGGSTRGGSGVGRPD
jgi:hypothetical protein